MGAMPIRIELSVLLVSMLAMAAFGQTTSLVSIDGKGRLTYKPDSKGNVIPDFSYVGYHHSERAIPEVPVRRSIKPVAGDNGAHIQQAIDAVAALAADANGHRGAVFLDAGLYPVSGSIIMKSGVVLRGAGTGTILKPVNSTVFTNWGIEGRRRLDLD